MMQTVKQQGRGFTLLELLVVVLILGILVSLASLSFSTNEMSRIKEETQRLASLMSLAREQAILDGQEIAVAFTDSGYQFEVFDGKGWMPMEGDDLLRRRGFPDVLSMEINLIGEPMKLAAMNVDEEADADTTDEKKKAEEEPVRVFLLSSGEVTPFELFMGHEDASGGYLLSGDALGKLSVKTVDETT